MLRSRLKAEPKSDKSAVQRHTEIKEEYLADLPAVQRIYEALPCAQLKVKVVDEAWDCLTVRHAGCNVLVLANAAVLLACVCFCNAALYSEHALLVCLLKRSPWRSERVLVCAAAAAAARAAGR